MPWTTPTPQQLRDRIGGEFQAVLPGSDARQRRSIEGVSTRAIAVGTYGLHQHVDWVANQIMVDTSEDDWLVRQASLYGLSLIPAASATGKIRLTGTAGATVVAGTELRRADDARFITAADATIGGTTADVVVTAVLAGAAGNSDIGTALTLLAPVASIQSQAAVIDDGSGNGLSGGADIEEIEDLRARLLTRMQKPPQGGADYDYAAWALEVPGVAVGKVWVYPARQGYGTVGLSFLMKDGDGYRLPTATEVGLVQAHVDAARPVTAQLFVFAAVARPFDLTISLTPDTAAIRAAVHAELVDFFFREAKPETPLYRSRLKAAISIAADEDHHKLLVPAAGADLVPGPGEYPTLGTITWAAG